MNLNNQNHKNVNILDLIDPFDTIDQLLQAMHICNKLKHYANSELNIIQECLQYVSQITITDEQLKNFIDKIEFNQSLFPTLFVQSIQNNEKNLNNYCNSKCYATREFKTNRSICSSCFCPLNDKSIIKTYKRAVVYYLSSPPEYTFNTSLTCSNCKTEHFSSYYINSNRQKYFYPDSIKVEFISFTHQTIFERKIFELYTAELHNKQCSFKSYCDTYNTIFASQYIKRNFLGRETFTESWFYFNLLLYQNEFHVINEFAAPQLDQLDTAISHIRADLFETFVKKWSGDFHCSQCNHNHCSTIINIDGIWKITRCKCGHEEIFLNSPEVKPIKTGCRLSPKLNSYYCEHHDIPEPVTKMRINNEYHTYRIKSIRPAPLFHASRKIKKIHDVFYVEYVEKTKTKKPIKTNKQAKNKWMKKNQKKSSQSSTVMLNVDNDDENNALYLVESVDNYVDNFYWLKKEQIPIEIYNTFLKELISREGLDEYDEITCNTNKHFCTPYSKKNRTKGLLISAYNCGIINGFRELYGSESISQVVLYYLDLISYSKKLPEIFLYDDACHLRK